MASEGAMAENRYKDGVSCPCLGCCQLVEAQLVDESTCVGAAQYLIRAQSLLRYMCSAVSLIDLVVSVAVLLGSTITSRRSAGWPMPHSSR